MEGGMPEHTLLGRAAAEHTLLQSTRCWDGLLRSHGFAGAQAWAQQRARPPRPRYMLLKRRAGGCRSQCWAGALPEQAPSGASPAAPTGGPRGPPCRREGSGLLAPFDGRAAPSLLVVSITTCMTAHFPTLGSMVIWVRALVYTSACQRKGGGRGGRGPAATLRQATSCKQHKGLCVRAAHCQSWQSPLPSCRSSQP